MFLLHLQFLGFVDDDFDSSLSASALGLSGRRLKVVRHRSTTKDKVKKSSSKKRRSRSRVVHFSTISLF